MNCGIAHDLLPLYAEGLCSQESQAALEEHLKTCPGCRALLAESAPPKAAETIPPEESALLRKISREWKRQKRRSWRRGILLGIALLLGLALLARPLLMLYLKTGAMGTETDMAGDLLCGYNRLTGEAFAASYCWDGREETMDFTVPDTVFGYRVTSLGGFVGRGAPCAFAVELPEDMGIPRESFEEALWEEMRASHPNAAVVELPFTLHLGREVKEVALAAVESCFGYDPNGREILWHITLTVDCDAGNETFYAENGILYDRNSGKALLGTAE